MPTHVVSDTGPLISLEKISDGYELIRTLDYKIFIPPKVLEEISEGITFRENYLHHFNIEDIVEVHPISLPPPPFRLRNDFTKVNEMQ